MNIAQIGEAVLATPARLVTDDAFASDAFAAFLQALKETLMEAGGVGIAAPQVFDHRAILIIASRPTARYPHAPLMEPTVLINPHILAHSETMEKDWEGCLSVPGLRGKVKRYTWVDVEYQNEAGDLEQQRFKGFVARIFQHEFDHLQGKTWLDHIENTRDIVAEEVWRKQVLAQA